VQFTSNISIDYGPNFRGRSPPRMVKEVYGRHPYCCKYEQGTY
jgi:hypothetical protein